MGIFSRLNKPKKKVGKPVDSLCPYCESKIDKLIMKFVKGNYTNEDDGEIDYEWTLRLYVCPHCKKILSVKNWE